MISGSLSITCSATIFRLAPASRTARSGPYRSMKTSTAAGRAGQFSAIPGPNAAFAAASSSSRRAARNFARSIEGSFVYEFRRPMHHVAEPGGVLGGDDVLVEAGGGW